MRRSQQKPFQRLKKWDLHLNNLDRPDLIKYYNGLGFISSIMDNMVIIEYKGIKIGELELDCEVDDILEYYKEYEKIIIRK